MSPRYLLMVGASHDDRNGEHRKVYLYKRRAESSIDREPSPPFEEPVALNDGDDQHGV